MDLVLINSNGKLQLIYGYGVKTLEMGTEQYLGT